MKQTMMKNGILMLFFFLASCGKDDPAPKNPTIVATSTQISGDTFYGIYYPSDSNKKYGTLTVDISGNAPAGFSKIVVSRISNGNATVIATLEKPIVSVTSGQTFNIQYNYDIQLDDVGQAVELKAEVYDKQNKSANLTIAKLNTLMATKKFDLILSSDNDPGDVVSSTDYFIMVLPVNHSGAEIGGHVRAMSPDDLNVDKRFEFVPLVFDYNFDAAIGGNSGPYFASPKAVMAINPKLVSNFITKSTTEIRIATFNSMSQADMQILDEIGLGNAHELTNVFNHIPPSPNPELAYLNKPSDYFLMFKLSDGRIGVIANIVYNESKKQIEFSLWISSK
jgi:hypothetical protein